MRRVTYYVDVLRPDRTTERVATMQVFDDLYDHPVRDEVARERAEHTLITTLRRRNLLWGSALGMIQVREDDYP